MNTTKNITTRRAFGAGMLTLALLGTAACSSEPEAPAPAETSTTAPVEEVDNHGEDSDLNQDVYELVEVTSPTTITVQLSGEGSEPIDVRLLGLADVKAKGESETAWAPQKNIDQAKKGLANLIGENGILLVVDENAPADTDEDGALLRYVDLLIGDESPEIFDAGDLLIQQSDGVYDPDEQWQQLERMERYRKIIDIQGNNGTISELWQWAADADGNATGEIIISR